MMSRNPNLKSGFTLVEAVLSSAVILVVVLALISVHNLYLKSALSNGGSLKAAYLAEEGIEAMRYLRDYSWDQKIVSLSSAQNYGVSLTGSVWQTGLANQWIDGFERIVTIGSVYRDANKDIVLSGGTLDPDARLVTVTVSWPSQNATATKSISTYLTNLWNN